MKDVEQLLRKIIEQSGDNDAQFLYGVEFSSETDDPGWKALVRFTKDGVSPVIVAAPNKAKLKKELQRYLDGDDVKDINIRYHQGQIDLELQAVRFHQNLIKEYESPSGELPSE